MGMSASQARLLSLTARMSDLEFQAQSISNSKIRLAEQSESAALAYSNALNKQKLTVSDGNSNYIDATAYNLTNYNAIYEMDKQRFLKDSFGRVLVSNTIANAYTSSNGNLDAFLDNVLGYHAIPTGGTTGGSTNPNQFTLNYNDADIISNSIGADIYNGSTTLDSDITISSLPSSRGPIGMSDSISNEDIINVFTNFLNICSTSIGNTLKANFENTLGSSIDNELTAALNYAYTATYNKFICNTVDTDSTDGVQKGTTVNLGSDDCENKNQVCIKNTIENTDSSRKETNVAAVDNSQVVDTFLNFFDQYCAQHFGGTSAGTINSNATTRGNINGTGTSTAVINNNTNTTNPTTTYDATAVKSYTNIFNEIQANGYITTSNENMTNTEWLYAQLNNGNLHLSEWDEKAGANGQGDFVDIPWKTGDNSIQLKNDDTDMAKAEAQYDAAMASIQAKDKRFDLELKNIDTEHEAITQEVDTVKKVISNNIKRSFKIFEA